MKEWLGPLHGVTRKDDNVFRRGFLEQCVFIPRNPASALAANHPSWATVRTLTVENAGSNDSGENVLAQPAMRHLLALQECDGPLLEALALQTEFRLETLHLAWIGSRRRGYDPANAWSALLRARGLPRLASLELDDEVDLTPAMLRALLESRIGRQLRTLTFAAAKSQLPTFLAELSSIEVAPAMTAVIDGQPRPLVRDTRSGWAAG